MDKRLLTCASLCVGERIADIGTDHGYLPCYMVEEGLCKTAIACDIAPMPLESAKEHIASRGLQDKIQTLLTDGLENVPQEGITDIVIAGMGGEMICGILSKCKWIKDEKVNLVLQPMTKWDVLRKWLYENGFEVARELPCKEGKFVYSVMQARYIGKAPDYPCDLQYLYCGRTDGSLPDGEEYLSRQAMRLEKAGRGLLNSPEKSALGEEMLRLAKKITNK